MKTISQYTEANRIAWNEAMPRHQEGNKDKWTKMFLVPGYSVIENPELQKLKEIEIKGKDVAHLCCNNGVELMSLKNLGAKRCVGFDISDSAIDEASQRSEECGVGCEFVRTDVYEIEETYDGQFDVVYISIGCFGWMPDLKRFLARAAQLLKDGGFLFVYEQHPFADMLSSDGDTESDPLKVVEPYFKTEPYEENNGIDYVGKTTYKSKSMYWFVWTLSDILMGVLGASLSLQFFGEYTKDISANHSRNEKAGVKIPLSYILLATKPQQVGAGNFANARPRP